LPTNRSMVDASLRATIRQSAQANEDFGISVLYIT
jgi:hypothetical protein